jgi:hypothetical protein
MSELVKNKNGDWPKKKKLFSDKEINSDKVLHINFEDIEKNPKLLTDALTKRNKYHNRNK